MMFFRSILDTIFPPHEEALLVRSLRIADVRLSLDQNKIAPDITALLPFSAKDVRALIHQTKFFGNKKAAGILGELLSEHITARYSTFAIAPIPLSSKRYRERGYNQVALIVEGGHLPSHPHLLTRARHTVPQTSLGRKERLTNLTDAFKVDVKLLARIPLSTHILIIDDVTTTGATLESALAALRAASPSHTFIGIALAH